MSSIKSPNHFDTMNAQKFVLFAIVSCLFTLSVAGIPFLNLFRTTNEPKRISDKINVSTARPVSAGKGPRRSSSRIRNVRSKTSIRKVRKHHKFCDKKHKCRRPKLCHGLTNRACGKLVRKLMAAIKMKSGLRKKNALKTVLRLVRKARKRTAAKKKGIPQSVKTVKVESVKKANKLTVPRATNQNTEGLRMLKEWI